LAPHRIHPKFLANRRKRGEREVNWYRCVIRGENFPGALVGENKPIGFYTTQFVQDISPDAAELQALSLLKQHDSLQVPAGVEKPNTARVYFEEIAEVRADEVPEQKMGLSFYPMND
jgi:hypothetical protein